MVEAQIARVLIAENSTDIQAMIQKILTVAQDISIVGATSSGEQAVQMALDLQPDVVLLANDLQDMNSLQVTKNILEKLPQAGVVFVMDESPSEQQMAAMIDAGVRDCLSNRPSLNDLAIAIRQASQVGKSESMP